MIQDYLEAAYKREKELQAKMLEERVTFHNIISELHEKKVWLEVRVDSMEKEISLLRRLLKALKTQDNELYDQTIQEMDDENIARP